MTPTIDGYEELDAVDPGPAGTSSRAFTAVRTTDGRKVRIDLYDAVPDATTVALLAPDGPVGSHDHVVAILDAGETGDGTFHVVTEAAEHGSYHDWFARHSPLRAADVLSMGVEIAGALATAHAHGLAHGAVTADVVHRSPLDGARLGGWALAEPTTAPAAAPTTVTTTEAADAPVEPSPSGPLPDGTGDSDGDGDGDGDGVYDAANGTGDSDRADHADSAEAQEADSGNAGLDNPGLDNGDPDSHPGGSELGDGDPKADLPDPDRPDADGLDADRPSADAPDPGRPESATSGDGAGTVAGAEPADAATARTADVEAAVAGRATGEAGNDGAPTDADGDDADVNGAPERRVPPGPGDDPSVEAATATVEPDPKQVADVVALADTVRSLLGATTDDGAGTVPISDDVPAEAAALLTALGSVGGAGALGLAGQLQNIEARCGVPRTEVPGHHVRPPTRRYASERPSSSSTVSPVRPSGGPVSTPHSDGDPDVSADPPEKPGTSRATPLPATSVGSLRPQPSGAPIHDITPPKPEGDTSTTRRWTRTAAVGVAGVVLLVAIAIGVTLGGDDDSDDNGALDAAAATSTTVLSSDLVPPACPELAGGSVFAPSEEQPAPADISIDAVGDGALRVRWTDRTEGAAGHVVFLRCTSDAGVTTRQVAVADPGSSGATIVGAAPGAQWCVTVGAIQPDGGTVLPVAEDQFACVET